MATRKTPAKRKPRAKPKSRKGVGGRPSKMTAQTLAKLEEAFLMGCSDTEACLFADIVPSTLYRYQESNPEYSERKEALKSNPVMIAKRIQLADLEDREDSVIAQKVIDRKEGTKVAVTGADGGPLKTENVSITAEMTPEEAGRIYAEFIRSD